jgi:hypothetical protein
MKTQRNNRWKWMAGATAATAAGVSASQAGLVTINLSNNFISATGGNHLNADLTGDGVPDVNIANPYYKVVTGPTSNGLPVHNRYYAHVELNGVHANAFFSNDFGSGFARLGSHHSTYSVTGSIPITFTDLHFNNGAPTKGSLQVTVFSGNGRPETSINLDSLTFHTPDNGSSLALLAMGVGGVLVLRRRRAAQNGVRS